jgi:hypothetical protein
MLLVLLTEASLTRAQWPAYGVYHTVGTITCVPAKGGSTQAVHKGSWIYAGDKLLLVDAMADLILFDRDSNYIHVKGKGSYTIAELQKMQSTHVRDNITTRYLSLLWEELFRPGGGGEMSTGSTGGVSRGFSLMLTPGDTCWTSMDSVVFSWQTMAWGRRYRLSLRDEGGQTVFDSLVADSMVYLVVSPPLMYGHAYNWTLVVIGDSGRQQEGAMGLLELVDEGKVLPQLSIADAGPDSALVWAALYEQQGCTRAANAIYLRLLAAESGDKALRALYREFRLRNYISLPIEKEGKAN